MPAQAVAWSRTVLRRSAFPVETCGHMSIGHSIGAVNALRLPVGFRQLAGKCAGLQDFMIFNAVGGGTGSGLGR